MANDNRNTTRLQDWRALWQEIKKFPRGRIGHKLVNIGVEELRRWGWEVKRDDGSYKWP